MFEVSHVARGWLWSCWSLANNLSILHQSQPKCDPSWLLHEEASSKEIHRKNEKISDNRRKKLIRKGALKYPKWSKNFIYQLSGSFCWRMFHQLCLFSNIHLNANDIMMSTQVSCTGKTGLSVFSGRVKWGSQLENDQTQQASKTLRQICCKRRRLQHHLLRWVILVLFTKRNFHLPLYLHRWSETTCSSGCMATIDKIHVNPIQILGK